MGSKRIGLARTQALLENLKRQISLGAGTAFLGLLKWNYGEDAFNAPPFVPGLQESLGVDCLDAHTAMHEAVFVNVGSNTNIWEHDTSNSADLVTEVSTNINRGGFKLTSGGSSGHQTALATAATNYECATGKPWWVKTRFSLNAHDTTEFFFGLTERAANVDSFHLTVAGGGTDRIGFVKAAHNVDDVTFAATKDAEGTISTALSTAQTYDANNSVVSYGIHWDGAGSIQFWASKVASGQDPTDMVLVHTYDTAAGISDQPLRLALMVETGAASAAIAKIEYIKGAYTK